MLELYFIHYVNVAKTKIKEFFTDETGAVDIVAIVVLIGIAVLLALTFQKEIEGLLKTLFQTISGNANNAVNGTPAGE